VTVDVVVVTYNSQATVAAALRSVIGDPLVATVVVVDNVSVDGSVQVAEGMGATVVRSPVNSGFGTGCNLGAAQGGSPWLFFLNPDAALEPGSLAGMVDHASGHPRVGVVASEVREPTGEPQPVRRRFPVWWRAFAEPGLAARWDEWHYRRRSVPAGGPVDWVSAAAILVRREAFEEVGGFDEGFFLYSEETDLCWRLRHAGYATHWLPGCPSSHRSGSSTGQLAGAGKEEWARGFGRYLAKHPERRRLMRASLLLGLSGRALVWAAAGRRENYRKWRAAVRAFRAA
jgi:N-acetylglucosaminyl-diphospho-decaprenol L-rhamnosyltransferase